MVRRCPCIRQGCDASWRCCAPCTGLAWGRRSPRLHALLDRGHVGEILWQHAAPTRVIRRRVDPLRVRLFTFGIQLVAGRFEDTLVGVVSVWPGAVAQGGGEALTDLEVGKDLPGGAALGQVFGIDGRPEHAAGGVVTPCRRQPVIEYLTRGCVFGQLLDQTQRGVHQRSGGGRVGLLERVALHFGGGYPRISAGSEPDLGLGLRQVLRRVVANVAVAAVGGRPAAEVAELVELRMGGCDVVGLVERLHRHLPVALEGQPLSPLAAHVLQPERVEHGGRGLQVLAQWLRGRIHVDPDPAAPGVDVDRGQVGVLRGQRALPVQLLGDVDAVAVLVVGPAVEPADERLFWPQTFLAPGGMSTSRRPRCMQTL